MQAASDATDGSMVSVIGLSSDKVQDICDAAAKQSGEPVQVSLQVLHFESRQKTETDMQNMPLCVVRTGATTVLHESRCSADGDAASTLKSR